MIFLKKSAVGLVVLLIAFMGIIFGQSATIHLTQKVARAAPPAKVTGQQERYKNLELFQKVLHFVENNYVEKVDNTDLVHGAIKGMMETLDPHSNFLPPEVFKDMKIDTSGKFGGLGIEIGIRDNVLTIIAPIEDTPAWRAGLKPGDRIVKIEEKSTKGMTLVEAVQKMRGKKGTKVTISIFRQGLEEIRDIAITRDVIKIRAVKYEMLEARYGWVRLSSFNENAARDVGNAIKKLEKEGKGKLKGLVLDMRTNPGGLLDQAVEVSSLFIDEGVVVSTAGKDKNRKEVKHAHRGKARKDFPVAVLVNSSTASAAEIVAGALQDHGRAVIMGQTTFGKGSVQTVIDLGQNMGLKLTIARYYTPSGRSIQEKGVEPDIFLEQYDPKLLEKAKVTRNYLREKDLDGHIVGDGDKKDKKDNYSKDELKNIGKKQKDGEDNPADDFQPLRMDPKEDFQVREALNYLKSYEIFQKMGKSAKNTSG